MLKYLHGLRDVFVNRRKVALFYPGKQEVTAFQMENGTNTISPAGNLNMGFRLHGMKGPKEDSFNGLEDRR
ncbi:hypothetical protein B9G55_15475 [Saccharibacillus sp. O16]|nr:hypothetical protein B9G55_15475 [Saccharibacillus sp. O16]